MTASITTSKQRRQAMLQIIFRFIRSRSRIESTILNIAVWNMHTSLIILFVTMWTWNERYASASDALWWRHGRFCMCPWCGATACAWKLWIVPRFFSIKLFFAWHCCKKSNCSMNEGLLIFRSFLHPQATTWRWAPTFPGLLLQGDTSTKL